MASGDQPGDGWTVVLRRQPARIVQGRPEGGYTDLFEIICCDCGGHPDLDYSEVSPILQQVRGPYPLPAGVTCKECVLQVLEFMSDHGLNVPGIYWHFVDIMWIVVFTTVYVI